MDWSSSAEQDKEVKEFKGFERRRGAMRRRVHQVCGKHLIFLAQKAFNSLDKGLFHSCISINDFDLFDTIQRLFSSV